MKRPAHPKRRGLALVVILALIVITTILIVAFTVSMRTERQAASSMANDQSAKLLAQNAINHAMAILDSNIPQPVASGTLPPSPTNWIVNPGLLTLVSGPSEIRSIPLSSNPTKDYPQSNPDDANLNIRFAKTNDYAIVATNLPLRVAWIPVLKDPLSAASATNEIIGRYGFWMDDENAKINVNTAYGKPASTAMNFNEANPLATKTLDSGSSDPTIPPYVPAPSAYTTAAQMANSVGTTPVQYYPLWHPSAVNVDILGSNLDRNAMVNWICNAPAGKPSWRWLSSPEQIKQFVTTNPDAYFNQNKFLLTSWGRDPEFNVFGKSRLFLDKRIPNVYDARYFQFDRDAYGPTYFHGYENAQRRYNLAVNTPYIPDQTGLAHVADNISLLLARKDWPGMPKKSFVDKWGGTGIGEREADQVAWNIAILGNYAGGGEDVANSSGWAEDIEPLSTYLRNQDPSMGPSTQWPGRAIRKGRLSGKAIVPYLPRAMVTEIAMTILPEPLPPIQADPALQKYRLKITYSVEFYLGDKVPHNRIKGQFAQKFVFTHFEYVITDSTGTTASQGMNKYDQGAGVKYLQGSLAPPEGAPSTQNYTVRPGSYYVVTSDLPSPINGLNQRWIYPRQWPADQFSHSATSTSFGPNAITSAPTEFRGTVTITGNLRLVTCVINNDNSVPIQLIPVWDAQDGNPSMAPPASGEDRIPFNFQIDLAALGPLNTPITRSLQIGDARLGGLATKWMQVPSTPGDLDPDSLGAENNATTSIASQIKKDKWGYFDNQNAFYSSSPRSSIGLISMIPTGQQRGLPGETLKLQPSGSANDLPDWLLLDLFAPTMTPNTTMNSTLGKVNVNARIEPSFGVSRWQPLQAVFENMKPATTVGAGGPASSAIVDNILNHTLAAGGHDFGAQGSYDYTGEICEIAGVADSGATDWDKEMLIRNLANILTTRSNTFSVWGVAQTIKKKQGNTNYGTYQAGDTITGEKRFQAIIERYVWPGLDGVPGNGHVGASGKYDRLSSPVWDPTLTPRPWTPLRIASKISFYDRWDEDPAAGGQWAALDGPDAPSYSPTSTSGKTWGAIPYQNTTMDEANNPLSAVMKYRVISLKYLTD